MASKNSFGERSLKLHRKLRGKISVSGKTRVRSMADLNLVYTPGVAAVSTYLSKNKKETHNLTLKGNSVAIISDGSAVLGLGNIGPEGAIPVMEGKALLFKEFAGIDAFPIVLATQNVEEIIATVKHIAPVFGGINLEDISAPRCFEIEERLKQELDIPVMHDDQHGTAIVVLAALMNAFRVVKKNIKKSTIVVAGAGAAGTAIAKLLLLHGVGDVIVLDSKGILSKKRHDLNESKKKLARISNYKNRSGGLREALKGADAVIGVSGPKSMSASDIKLMAKDAIVFGLANPIPEIMPEEAHKGGAAVVATGRSDFPNQVNNSLAFPGVFRGALDRNVHKITDSMKLNAAHALAKLVQKPTKNKIIPTVFEKGVVEAVSGAIR